MMFLYWLPVLLSYFVLGAHFLRMGNVWLMGVCVGLGVLGWIGRKWVWVVVQVGLMLGVVEWMGAMWVMREERMQEGRPWVRMVVILGAVVVLTGGTSVLMWSRRMRERYGVCRVVEGEKAEDVK